MSRLTPPATILFELVASRAQQVANTTITRRQNALDRAATAECVNAQARNRGLLRMPVRGLAKVRCVVKLFALAHNLMRIVALAPELIGWGTASCAAAANPA